jgi:hypothetical protein
MARLLLFGDERGAARYSAARSIVNPIIGCMRAAMPYGNSRLYRSRFILWNPRTWWDRSFIRAGMLFEHLWAYSIARWLLKGVVALFRLFVWGVSPAQGFGFQRPPTWPRILLVAVGAALAAYVFSYWLNYLFAFLAGTLSGSDTTRRYFLADRHNIQIYTLIAPAYIACASAIIYVYAVNASLTHSAQPHPAQSPSRRGGRFAFFVLLVASMAVAALWLYYQQVVTNYGVVAGKTVEECKDITYWFVERGADGKLALNVSGFAYFFGNFVRLAIVLASALCFVAASAAAIRLGLQIRPDGHETYDVEGVRRTLYSFSIIELWTKGLYLILNTHGKVWGDSCLKGDLNIKVANILLIIVGLIILTIPRNFVEYRLWRYLRERAAIDPAEGLPDLRSEQMNWLYSMMASAFFLAVAFLFMILRLGPEGISELLELFWKFARG